MDDDILFDCSIDKSSERDIVDALSGLNYLVDNFIFNLLMSNQLQGSPLFAVPSPAFVNVPKSTLDQGLLTYLTEHCSTAEDAWNTTIDFFLRNIIFSLIHTYFFDGEFFFGVGSDIHRQYLDRLMSQLMASGMLSKISVPNFFFFIKNRGFLRSLSGHRYPTMAIDDC